jgi:hypothetical protein
MGLLRWQWEGYPRYHLSRGKLLLHIVAVPLFLIANVGLVAGLSRGSLGFAALGLGGMVASMALQKIGHKAEENPPVPFAGPANALGRVFLEQWINFPRFVLTGGWARALRRTTP